MAQGIGEELGESCERKVHGSSPVTGRSGRQEHAIQTGSFIRPARQTRFCNVAITSEPLRMQAAGRRVDGYPSLSDCNLEKGPNLCRTVERLVLTRGHVKHGFLRGTGRPPSPKRPPGGRIARRYTLVSGVYANASPAMLSAG